jgi:hypothetical protein
LIDETDQARLGPHFARRNQTGTGVYAENLLRQLGTIPELQIEVLEGWSKGKRGATRSVRAAQSMANLAWLHMWLPGVLRRLGVDLLHAPAFLAPISAHCPVVVTMHDVSYLRHPESFAPRWKAT